jgi:hypothetical protein
LYAKFIIEISDISNINPILLGIRKTEQEFTSGDYNYYAAIKITPESGTANGNITFETKGAASIISTPVDSPQNGLFVDGDTWEFTVSLSNSGHTEFKPTCRRRAAGTAAHGDSVFVSTGIPLPPQSGGGGNSPFIPEDYAPFIHVKQSVKPGAPVILHSLQTFTDGEDTTLSGGGGH